MNLTQFGNWWFRTKLHVKHLGNRLRYISTNVKSDNIVVDNENVILVVARYNEDVSWLKDIDLPYVIYNKGKNDLVGFNNVVKLPNVGREAHTYLHYIIRNYQNLPNRIIFTQGDPFAHDINFVANLAEHQHHLDVQPLSIQYLPALSPLLKNRLEYTTGIPNEQYSKLHSQQNGKVKYYVEKLDTNLDISWPYAHRDEGIHNLKFVKKNKLATLKALCIANQLPITESIFFNYSAQFSVSRNRLIDIPYARILAMMSFVLKHPEHVYLMERLWLTAFNYEPIQET